MKTIIWKGLLYQSTEHCKIKKEEGFFMIDSKIEGSLEAQNYSVAYRLKINPDWEIQNFEIESQVDHTRSVTKGYKINRDWYINGGIRNEFSNFDFIDISLSPFTNTLPINHLNFEKEEEKIISVIYINLLENKIEPQQQKYIKISDAKYKYENIPNDFEAVLEVDGSGFVRFYPGLFEQM